MFDFNSKLAHFPEKAQACIRDGIHRSLSTVFMDLVSGVCNQNCIFCDGKYLPLERRMFETERLMRLADELVSLGVDSVIIVGEGPDEETILFAARLAALYSKGRGSSRVPVDYTLRRYVKKPGGAKPGFVIYTNQRTLFVQPAEEPTTV